jgi:hypothetical protein
LQGRKIKPSRHKREKKDGLYKEKRKEKGKNDCLKKKERGSKDGLFEEERKGKGKMDYLKKKGKGNERWTT